MASALTGITAAGVTLAEALVEAGAVDEDKMIEYGLIGPAPTEAPEKLTADVYTDNLIQVYVVYNKPVDKETAEKVDNYELKGEEIKSAKLQDDGVTVVLTLDLEGDGVEQQTVADLTIKNVKDLDGQVIEKTTLEVEFFDKDIPEVVSAEVIGNNTFKVVFSEPMKILEREYFVVNNGRMYVKSLTPQNNRTEVLVEMYSTLKEGEVTLQIKSGNEDYAGFGVIGKVFTLEVVADEEAPVVVGYQDAKRNEVTLIWNEDIKLNFTLNDKGELVDENALKNFYHTNSNNPATKVTKDGNKLTIEFGPDDDYWMPPGTAYVYVLKDSVKDYWDNKNTQQMVLIEVEVDEEPPVVEEIKVEDEDEIKIKFNEALDEDSANDRDNYILLDDKGEEVKNVISRAEYDNDKTVTISFYKERSGDHTLVIKGVKDLYGNKMPETAIDFTIGDITPPDADKFSAVIYNQGKKNQMIVINFGEKMALEGKYAVNDAEKYEIDGTALTDFKDYKLEVAEDGEVVEIYIPVEVNKNKEIPTGEKVIKLTRVADAAGNYTDGLLIEIDLKEADKILFDEDEGVPVVEAVEKDTIKIRFADNVAKFDIDDILVSKLEDREDAIEDAKKVKDAVYKIDIAGVDVELDDGKTVVTIKLGEDMDSYNPEVYVHVVGSKSENAYGRKLAEQTEKVKDKIKPEVVKDGVEFDSDNKVIKIEYTEELKNVDDYRYAHDLIVVTRDGKTLVADEDYRTEVEGKILKVEITKSGIDSLDKFTIECRDKILYIKDLNDNLAKPFDKVKN